MPYLYLIISIIGVSFSNLFTAFYNKKNDGVKGAEQLYSFVRLAVIFLFYLILFVIDLDFKLDLKLIVYTLIFALSFCTTSIVYVYALQSGPFVLSNLILQLSVILVSVWGFIFWNDKLTLLVGIGLFLIVLSIVLCLYSKNKDEKQITFKWVVLIGTVFLTNAICTIIQKTQQMDFSGKYGSFFMMASMFIATAISFIIYLKSDKSQTKLILKTSWHYPALSAVFNAVLNLCIMLLATSTLSPSLIYPTFAIASIAITTLFSTLVFKEKIYWWQWVGVFVGTVAVVLLSI